MFEDEPLQTNMMDAWRERANRVGKVIEAHLRGFATREAAVEAERDFQYSQAWLGYWMRFGHRREVN